jgi:hypothetical protein
MSIVSGNSVNSASQLTVRAGLGKYAGREKAFKEPQDHTCGIQTQTHEQERVPQRSGGLDIERLAGRESTHSIRFNSGIRVICPEVEALGLNRGFQTPTY